MMSFSSDIEIKQDTELNKRRVYVIHIFHADIVKLIQ